MRRILIFSLFIFTTISCKSPEKQSEEIETKSPNIVYILADDLGYGDVSAFNPESKIKTPFLDKLAEEGMRFSDAHTSSSVCTPSRYSILTGRYNWRSPLKSSVLTGTSGPLIPKDRTTVASLLKKNGYQTAFIGKWHLGWDWALKDPDTPLGSGWEASHSDNIDYKKPISNSPRDLGFTYYYALPASLDMAPYVYVENDSVTSLPNRMTENEGKYSWWRKGPTGANFDHQQVTPHFFEKAINYIEESAQQDEPFFLYLALPSPHTPILPNEAWRGKSGLNPYGDFVMEIDYYMGQLMKVLEDAGVDENTLVVFTSDNGCSPQADFEVLNEAGHNPSYIYRGSKADIYEGGHRVPFIVKWPKEISPRSFSEQTISTTDFLATCAAITGTQLKENEGEDSFSMLPLFKENTAAEFERKATVVHSINGSFALTKGDWKMIFVSDSGGWSYPEPGSEAAKKLPKFQLYNLKNDPQESKNLYLEQPEVSRDLKELMASIIENGRSTPGPKQQNELPMNGKEWKQIEIFKD